MAGMISWIHLLVQPEIDRLFGNYGELADDTKKRITALRMRRKKMASVCMFLAFSAAILGVESAVGFPAWLTAVLLVAAALWVWRSYTSKTRYGWVWLPGSTARPGSGTEGGVINEGTEEVHTADLGGAQVRGWRPVHSPVPGNAFPREGFILFTDPCEKVLSSAGRGQTERVSRRVGPPGRREPISSIFLRRM